MRYWDDGKEHTREQRGGAGEQRSEQVEFEPTQIGHAVHLFRRNKTCEKTHPPYRKDNSGTAAHRCECKSLGCELVEQSRRRCAKSVAHGDFAPALAGSRQKYSGY